MALHEITVDRRPVEGSHAGETVTTDRRQAHRLYPSLPNIDGYEFGRSTGDKPHTAAADHPYSLLADAQSEASAAAGRDVRMKAQILILEEQRQELMSINERWAKEYRTMREYYKEKVQDLKALRQHGHSPCEEEPCEGGEKNITLQSKVKDEASAQARGGVVIPGLLRAEKETNELRAQNSTLTRRGQHQHEEIQRLNKALEEALQTAQPLDLSGETLRDIWKHQIKETSHNRALEVLADVYKEDFLKERRDREKLKEKYLELEKKFRKVHSELRALKPQVTWTRPLQSALECTCTNGAKRSNWEVRPVNQHHVQLQRRYTCDNKL